MQPGRYHVVGGIAAGVTDHNHDNARLHLANIGDVGHFCLTIAPASWGMRTRIATYKPFVLLPLWSRLDVPVVLQFVRGCRSSGQLGHRPAEPPPHLQAVLSPPWLP